LNILTPPKNSKCSSSLNFRDISIKFDGPSAISKAHKPTKFDSDIYIRVETAGHQSFAKSKHPYLLKKYVKTVQPIGSPRSGGPVQTLLDPKNAVPYF
jgi:hypothetical protein